MMTKVLLVSNVYPPHVFGGAEVVAHRQALALTADGFDVIVFAGRFSRDEQKHGQVDIEEVHGLTVYRVVLPMPENPALTFYKASVGQKFKSLLNVFDPDIVHFHNLNGMGVNLLPVARSRSRAKIVVTLHDYWPACFKNTLLRNDNSVCRNAEECNLCLPPIEVKAQGLIPARMRRDYVAWCVDLADHIVSPSRFLRSFFAETNVIKTPIQHISNGIEIKTDGRPQERVDYPIRFASFSYLGEHKGIDTLTEAAEILAGDPTLRGKWQLTVAGHGHLSARLQSAISEGRLGDAVKAAGRLSHAQALALHSESQVVVLASRWPENESVTLLESIVAGRAQIASRIGGNVELIDEGKSGLLFAPGDVADLVAAMRKFIQNPELATEFGQYNYERRNLFDAEKSMSSLKELYNADSTDTAPDVVVICVGRCADLTSLHMVELLVSRFYLVEDSGRRIRFISHEWVDELAWRQASLVWIWNESVDDIAETVIRALRAGVPILVPAGSPFAKLKVKANSLPYESWLDALAKIAALQTCSPEAPNCANEAAARMITASMPNHCFTLPL
jgi:glycosyltransferase involved in cell wall biosynthesis